MATNAFGMGIDKANVSYVVHYNMPKDIESYYQEAGRAGRNGKPAKCVLLYSEQDVRTSLWMIENGRDAKEPQDAALRKQVLERDRDRLREMIFYCNTSDCLRGYILKYFGETPAAHCGNCGNCRKGQGKFAFSALKQKILTSLKRSTAARSQKPEDRSHNK